MPDEVGDEADEHDGGRQSSAACGPRTEPAVAAHRFSVVFVSLTVQSPTDLSAYLNTQCSSRSY